MSTVTSYSVQRHLRDENRTKILETIRRLGPSKYSDIRKYTALSDQTLSKHLGELTRQGILGQRFADGCVQYYFMESMILADSIRRRLIGGLIQIVRDLTYSSSFLTATQKMAETDPVRFEAELNFADQLNLTIESEDYVHWQMRHPDPAEQKRLITEALSNELPPFPETSKEQVAWFAKFVTVIRNTVKSSPTTNFLRQNQSRRTTRQAILDILKSPTSFSELRERLRERRSGNKLVAASTTSLTKYLRELHDEDLVVGGIHVKRKPERLYRLTDEGQRRQRREPRRYHLFSGQSVLMRYLALDPQIAAVFHELGELARSNPRWFEEFLLLYEEALVSFSRTDFIHALNGIPKNVLDTALDEKLRLTLELVGKTGDLGEFIQLFDAFLVDLKKWSFMHAV